MEIVQLPPPEPPLELPEPIVRADALGWLLFEKPDPLEAERFFADFGLFEAGECTEGSLFRTAGSLPYAVVMRPGASAAFVGAGFLVATREELERLAAATGSSIEKLDRPGGGECVRLRDPHGFAIEVAHGVERTAPLQTRMEPLPANTPFVVRRVNRGQRPPLAPAATLRLGHYVVSSSRLRDAIAWYARHLGMIPSDVQCTASGEPGIAFMRLDRGTEPADHHTVALGFGFFDAFEHCAFEVIDVDAIGQGSNVLRAAGWQHGWGIGRHILGSQLFDYWRDADGHEFEHYADGDVYDASVPTQYSALGRGAIWQWGADMPGDFGPRPSVALLKGLIRGLRSGELSLGRVGALAGAMRKPPRPWLK